MTRALTEQELKKTSFGLINNLSELFEEFLYCSEVRVITTPAGHDRWGNYQQERGRVTTPHPNDFYFFASSAPQIKTWKTPMSSGSLWVKPKTDIADVIRNRCCEGRIGSFRIIPWEVAGVALVMATDALSIATPWVAFVPLNSLPNIDGTTLTGIPIPV